MLQAVLEHKVSKFFFKIYVLCGHLGQVTQLIYINFQIHSPINFYMNFSFKFPNIFGEKVLILKSE